MKEFLFCIVILLANIIQGITGFAGTILAMPFGLMLVGYDVAKPILNVLGILSGVYVFLQNRKSVSWKEVKIIVCIMSVGILSGIGIKQFVIGQERVCYRILGCFVLFLAVKGFFQLTFLEKKQTEQIQKNLQKKGISALLLVMAGIVHGIFVSGGPLLIGYLSKKIQEKNVFRATISTVWIVLNTVILVDDFRSGLWNVQLLQMQMVSIPFLLAGMWIGSRLYAKMSQKFFMGLTYVLLAISGISLFMK